MAESPCCAALRVLLLGAVLAGGPLAAAGPSEQAAPTSEPRATTTITELKGLGDTSPAALREAIWPAGDEGPVQPLVETGKDGDRTLSAWPIEHGCNVLLNEAEPAFRAKDYPAARAVYSKAVEQFPRCYLALNFLGDSYYFAGDAVEGARWYDRSLALNPDDYRTYFYRGNTLAHQGKKDEALGYYAHALALRPRAKSLSQFMGQNADFLGVEYVENLFTPRAVAKPGKAGGIDVHVDPAGPAHWLGYALCKARQLKQQEPGSEGAPRTWSAAAEIECLETLLESYQEGRRAGHAAAEAELEYLLEIARAGFLAELAIYEMGSRVAPTATLLLPLELRARMVEFVRRFVIRVKRAGS
ncbi:MAG TPA: tetratricopeptide repeat protein [Thermoanaerobaculia bacterium]|nr:tetratricopeptide repeat protein [Thermoanaerobaculia bacterium]